MINFCLLVQDGLYAVVWLHATNQRVSKKMAQSANVPELAYDLDEWFKHADSLHT